MKAQEGNIYFTELAERVGYGNYVLPLETTTCMFRFGGHARTTHGLRGANANDLKKETRGKTNGKTSVFVGVS